MVNPYFLDAAWEVVVHLEKGTLCEVFSWDTCDQDGGSLNRVGVSRCDEGVLTGCDEVGHFAFDVVPYPNYTGVMV